MHTAPGHGADDFDIWTANARHLRSSASIPPCPIRSAPDGYYRKHVPLFGGDGAEARHRPEGPFRQARRYGYANAAVIAALKEAGALAAMNPRHKHDYPHSWRSKAPVIYRNTPQWFIAMDKPNAIKGPSKRTCASLR